MKEWRTRTQQFHTGIEEKIVVIFATHPPKLLKTHAHVHIYTYICKCINGKNHTVFPFYYSAIKIKILRLLSAYLYVQHAASNMLEVHCKFC